MSKLLAGWSMGLALACALTAGCGSKAAPTGELSPTQISELQGFGREMWADYGTRQPPLETWVGAMPWLKFKRLELRPDGAYFIMDESDTEERGYAVVDSVSDFARDHPAGPDNQQLDTFVFRYRTRK
jgi:hypothetical protein